jgi:hypothetical protein
VFFDQENKVPETWLFHQKTLLLGVFEKTSKIKAFIKTSNIKVREPQGMAAFSEQPKAERIACRTKFASEASAEISTASSSWPGKKNNRTASTSD